MNPWEALGISRAEARDPATVKRAYAKQLKAHRPDRDPEGFRRVHDAYQALTGPMARWILEDDEASGTQEDAGGGAAPSDPDQPAATGSQPGTDSQDQIDTPPLGTPVLAAAPVLSFPGPKSEAVAKPSPSSALDRAWRKLEEALQRKDQVDEAAIVDACRDLLQVVPDRVAAGRRIGAMLASRPSVLVAVFDLDLLIALAADGESDPLFAVAEFLHERCDSRLRTLAESVAAASDLRHEGIQHFRLGMIVAIDHPQAGRKLANLAFTSMPTHFRGMLDQLDLRLRMGSELERWSPQLRRTLVTALDKEELPKDSVKALRSQISRLPDSSAVRHAAQSAFPTLRLQPTMAERQRKESARGGVSGTRWAWIVLVAVLVLGRIASCSRSSDPAPEARIPVRVVPSATYAQQNEVLHDLIFKQIKIAMMRGDQQRLHHWLRPAVLNQDTGLSTTVVRPAVLERILQDAEIPLERRVSCAEWVRKNGDASFQRTAVKFLSALDIPP